MKQRLVIVVLFLILVPGCAFVGWWLSKRWLQARLDDFDREALAAEALNAPASASAPAPAPAEGGGAAKKNGSGTATGAAKS